MAARFLSSNGVLWGRCENPAGIGSHFDYFSSVNLRLNGGLDDLVSVDFAADFRKKPVTLNSSPYQLAKNFASSKLGLYFIIGGVASLIDVGVFVFLYEWVGVSALLSHSISIPLSAIYSFTCNAFFNFKTTDNLHWRFLSFAFVVFLGYLLGAGVIWLVEYLTPFGGTVGKIVSLPLVFIFQYYLNSKISFRAAK